MQTMKTMSRAGLELWVEADLANGHIALFGPFPKPDAAQGVMLAVASRLDVTGARFVHKEKTP